MYYILDMILVAVLPTTALKNTIHTLYSTIHVYDTYMDGYEYCDYPDHIYQ